MTSVDSDGSSEESDSSLICGFGFRHRTNSDDSGHDPRAFQKKRSVGSGHGTGVRNESASGTSKRISDGNKQGYDKTERAMADFEESDAEFERNGKGRNGEYHDERDASHHYDTGRSNGYPMDPLCENDHPKHSSNSRNLRGIENEPKFIPATNDTANSVPTARPDPTGHSPKFKEGDSRKSCHSLDSSVTDLSMASEDAIVLMYNMDDDSCEGDRHNKRSRMEDNVVGKIYKGQEVCDPRSIPMELEITLSESTKNIHQQKDKKDDLASRAHKPTNEQSKNGTETNSEEDHEKRSPVRTTGKSKMSNPAQPANEQIRQEPQGKVVPSGGSAGDKLIPTKPPAVSKLSQEQNPGAMSEEAHSPEKESSKSALRPRGSMMEYEENLSIIEEDEDGDSSTGASAVGSADSADSESIAELNSSAVFNVVPQKAKQPIPIGARSRSTAEKMGVPTRRMPERESSIRNLDDGGRNAIVSRNSDSNYVKKVVPKSDTVKTLILDAMRSNTLFKACSEEEFDELVDVFSPSEVPSNTIIIAEGDEGDEFFVMERGTVDVYVGNSHMAVLRAGSSFGELALMYGCPRSATLRARFFCKLWSISRTAFRGITSQIKRRRNEEKIEFLKKVKIKNKLLSDVLSDTEMNTLALATLDESYDSGEIIIKEGDHGDVFYMIDSGLVDVFKESAGSAPVATLKSGQFFGEMALLSNDVRTASCVAKTDVKCHILMRHDFNLMLGDLQSLINEDATEKARKNAEVEEASKKGSKESFRVELSDLEQLKVLGIGAFGRVKLAKLKHPINGINSDDNFFALKCISKQSLKENGLEKHILNEKAIMSSLKHPFINRFYCDMEDEKYTYFLLEALTGGELCKRLREERKFPEEYSKFYSASVLFAFSAMHAKKIAYRDLKPENLVMDSTGYVKIVDFGLAKVIEGGKTWTLCGTPAYLAPEIVLNDGHDWAVDYWALGVFLYEMTSGKEPFRSKNPMEVYKQIVSGYVEIPESFSTNLGDLIRKLLNTSKSKRLGRTMGGAGAVMQQRWYSNFDWDAHLEKRLQAPLRPKSRETLGEDAEKLDSKEKGMSSAKTSGTGITSSLNNQRPPKTAYSMKPSRVSYSLGSGNRHHQKLLEIMGGETKEEKQADVYRMTMMRTIKQSEKWSRASDATDNDSTRNTSLGIGQKAIRRGSDNTDSGMSLSTTISDDAFLRLQLMQLSLSSKHESHHQGVNRAFQQFSLLSISPSSLIDEEAEFRDSGCHFLDPFATKNVDLIDQFPTAPSKTDIDAEALAAFCFPNGLRIRIIPRCAEEGARSLGWLGSKSDSFQLQGFTDVSGSLSHGVAITVCDELKGKDSDKVLSILVRYRDRRRAAVVICRWWRKCLRQDLGSAGSRTPGRNFSKQKGGSFRAGFERGFNMKRLSANGDRRRRRASNNEDSPLNGSFRATMDRVINRSGKGSFAISSSSDVGDSDDSDNDDASQRAMGHHSSVPDKIRRIGSLAYKRMRDAANMGDMCIVEKSYVMIGIPLRDQSLFFHALQNLIDMERNPSSQSKSKAGILIEKKRRSVFPEDRDDFSVRSDGIGSQNRHAVLSTLQSKLALAPSQRRVSHPRSELEHINSPEKRFVLDLSIMGLDKISLPLPLPEVSGQWGLATLFLRIKDSGLIILLKLLLLERSVLVVGETSEEVTACATALLELLDPYKWASAFMPLLPAEMLDFVSSPVPFIAGMIVEDKQHLHSIIHDPGVKEAMMCGLSIVNLVSGKLIVTREQGTSDMLRRSFQTIPELSLYQRRLDEYYRNESSNLRSFQKFFRLGITPKESLTLRKIKVVIRKHLSQFTMGLHDKSDAWQQYGEFNEATGTFDFCPDKFIQPLKDRMIFQIQFQEMMAHTQLFVGYVEELQKAHESRGDLLSGPDAKFIAQWLVLHWRRKHSR